MQVKATKERKAEGSVVRILKEVCEVCTTYYPVPVSCLADKKKVVGWGIQSMPLDIFYT